jgi:hypothetical protein
MLMDVIPLDASLVKGSHGIRPANVSDYPVVISSRPSSLPSGRLAATEIFEVIRRHVVE